MGPFKPPQTGTTTFWLWTMCPNGLKPFPCPACDAKVVIKLFRTIIFPRYGIPRVVISDGGSHFINKVFEKLMRVMESSTRMNAYENSMIYKMRTKAAHDKLIRLKDFKVGDSVLLFNSKLRLFPGKLRSKWSGPFKIMKFYHTDHSLYSTKRGRNSQ
ncbi:unnamed protein product [Microthlaspi erraticum]|uniref:Integrase catalytic domain-containing protein n=1 Tax=Microthlaspi erraticum TaxID=1685480 RepID=A0A6D2L0W1_9BRAS|nr:unnamed protein product [Microthlaspi erraticum]